MATRFECRTPGGRLVARIATRFTARARGLLGGPPLELDEALLIAPCSSIHTFGMRYPIDVVFLDRNARVVRVWPRCLRDGFGSDGALRRCWSFGPVKLLVTDWQQASNWTRCPARVIRPGADSSAHWPRNRSRKRSG